MKNKNIRIMIIYIIIGVAFLSLVIKLSYVKIIENAKYFEKAINLWTRSAPIRGTRGNIYDRNGKLIVGSVLTPTVVSIPRQIEDIDDASVKIAKVLGVTKDEIKKHLKKKVSVEILKPVGQKISIEKAIEISNLNLSGIYVVGDTTRNYEYGSLLSQVIGITGIDNQGITGIEAMYDEYLEGEYGALKIFTDAHGEEIVELSSLYQKAEGGADIYLTIDLDLQRTLERVLDNAVEQYAPNEVSGIILDPKTSEILAMASRPTFNPSNYKDYSSELYNRNIPIWKCYEPGSTFKICTYSAGLEEKVFSIDEVFYDPGYMIVDGARLRDWKAGGHGKETFKEVLQNSCNPGFVTIGLRLGKDKFFEYLEKFGFGKKTGVDLLGESKGIIFNKDVIGDVELATSAFGQGNSVTMIQLVNASNACINGGILYKPYILKKIVKDNEVILENKPTMIRRVISEETSMVVRDSLECVVALGTGRGGYIEGYRVGGKTGTAQIAIDGKYVEGKYILSFLGIAPMDDPSISCMIAIENPKNTIQYGGTVAAPMVKEVITESFGILNIDKRKDGVEFSPRLWIDKNIYTVSSYVGESISKLRDTSKYRFIVLGDGLTVRSQIPEAGEKIIEGGYVILYS